MKATSLHSIKEHDWIKIQFNRDYNQATAVGIVISTKDGTHYIVNEEGKDIVPINPSVNLTLKSGEPILLSYARSCGFFYDANKSKERYLRLMSYEYQD